MRTVTRGRINRTRRSTVQMLKSDIALLSDYLSQVASGDDGLSEAIDCCDQLIHRINRLRQDLTALERGTIEQKDLKGPLV